MYMTGVRNGATPIQCSLNTLVLCPLVLSYVRVQVYLATVCLPVEYNFMQLQLFTGPCYPDVAFLV